MRVASCLCLSLVSLLTVSTSASPLSPAEQSPLISRETIQEAAIHARTLISHRADGIATLVSLYAANDTVAGDHGIAGRPTGLLEYYAPGPNGTLWLLLMPISSNVRNVLESHEATVSIKDEVGERRHKQWGATDRARLVLYGTVERLETGSDAARQAEKAYLKVHPDAEAYIPPRGPHYALWARFTPSTVYYLGGFGDRHYIGYLPMELYRA